VSFTLDLVVLVPGKDDEETIRGLLSRPESLGVRPLSFRVLRHPRHDPGCFSEPVGVLQPFLGLAAKALVVFDYEGCGQEGRAACDVASDVRGRLEASGWTDRAEVIVIEPELEAWVWSDSPHVTDALGWRDRTPALREWLAAKGFLSPNRAKPQRPKEALLAALREARVQQSASIYREIAARVSLARCQDTAFGNLVRILREWSPQH
jgi:hypothetical protein